MYKSNGQCNDGGPDSEDGSCAYGTDCTDCGERPDFQYLLVGIGAYTGFELAPLASTVL